MDRKIRTRLAGVVKNKNDPGWDRLPPVLRHPTVLYTMVQKSKKWPKTQIKGGPALISVNPLTTKNTDNKTTPKNVPFILCRFLTLTCERFKDWGNEVQDLHVSSIIFLIIFWSTPKTCDTLCPITTALAVSKCREVPCQEARVGFFSKTSSQRGTRLSLHLWALPLWTKGWVFVPDNTTRHRNPEECGSFLRQRQNTTKELCPWSAVTSRTRDLW